MLVAFLILSAAASTPASETCAATKFTLNKPVAAQAPAKPKVVVPPKPKPKTDIAQAKPKTKPIPDCDKPKKG